MFNFLNSNLTTETYDSSYFNRFLILVKSRKKFIVAIVAALTLSTIINSLFNVPQYVSEYALQVDPYNMGKSMTSQALISNDLMSGKSMVNTAAALMKSDLFLKHLAEEIQLSVNKDELVIPLKKGFALQLNYALVRLGIQKSVNYNKADLSKLTPHRLGALLGSMLETWPNYGEKLLVLKATAWDPRTAFLINKSVMAAYSKTTTLINKKQLETSIGYYEAQVKSAREKVDQADDNVTQFLRAYPMLASEHTRLSFLTEFNALQARENQIKHEIDINVQLYNYYKSKYIEFDSETDSNLDLINKHKQELVELKYRKQVYKEKGYDASNPGIAQLTEQIEKIEHLIKKSSGALEEGTGKSIVSMGYLERVSGQLETLQDQMRVSKFSLQGVQLQIEKLRPQVNTVLQQSITLTSLRREAEIAAELLKDVSRRLQLAKARAEGEESVVSAINEPTLPEQPIGLPANLKILFSFFIGLALAFSLLLLKETFSPKILDRYTVEQIGFKYAGLLDDQIANQAEILSSLGCLDDPKVGKGPKIVLCTSPNQKVGLYEVQVLSRYLARSKRKSLIIVVSNAEIPTDYQITDDMGYAKIYRKPDGFEDLVHIQDPDTFSSMRSLLDQFGNRYQVVFIFVADPLSNLGYHMAQRVAKQLLLMGEVGEYSAQDYQRLVRGFSVTSEVYIVLIPPAKTEIKFRLARFFDKDKWRGSGSGRVKPPSAPPPPVPVEEETGEDDSEGSDPTKRAA